jgi:hypothetical protein
MIIRDSELNATDRKTRVKELRASLKEAPACRGGVPKPQGTVAPDRWLPLPTGKLKARGEGLFRLRHAADGRNPRFFSLTESCQFASFYERIPRQGGGQGSSHTVIHTFILPIGA